MKKIKKLLDNDVSEFFEENEYDSQDQIILSLALDNSIENNTYENMNFDNMYDNGEENEEEENDGDCKNKIKETLLQEKIVFKRYNKIKEIIEKLKEQHKITLANIKILANQKIKNISFEDGKFKVHFHDKKIQAEKQNKNNTHLLDNEVKNINSEEKIIKLFISENKIFKFLNLYKKYSKIFLNSMYNNSYEWTQYDLEILNKKDKEEVFDKKFQSTSLISIFYNNLRLMNIYIWTLIIKIFIKEYTTLSAQTQNNKTEKNNVSLGLKIIQKYFDKVIIYNGMKNTKFDKPRTTSHQNNTNVKTINPFDLKKTYFYILKQLNYYKEYFSPLAKIKNSNEYYKKTTNKIILGYLNLKEDFLNQNSDDYEKNVFENWMRTNVYIFQCNKKFLGYDYENLIMQIYFDGIFNTSVLENYEISFDFRLKYKKLTIDVAQEKRLSNWLLTLFEIFWSDENHRHFLKKTFNHLFVTFILSNNITQINEKKKINKFDDYRFLFYRYTYEKRDYIKNNMKELFNKMNKIDAKKSILFLKSNSTELKINDQLCLSAKNAITVSIFQLYLLISTKQRVNFLESYLMSLDSFFRNSHWKLEPKSSQIIQYSSCRFSFLDANQIYVGETNMLKLILYWLNKSSIIKIGSANINIKGLNEIDKVNFEMIKRLGIYKYVIESNLACINELKTTIINSTPKKKKIIKPKKRKNQNVLIEKYKKHKKNHNF